jgi:Rod binding domain-containing protein
MRIGITPYTNVAQPSAGTDGRSAGEAASTTGPSKTAAGGRIDPGQAKLLKLKKAATQFEAMLLEKWWSSMKESGLGEEDDSDAGAGTLNNMGMQAMSMAIASAGGIGIAAMLVHSLQAEIAAQHAAPGSAESAGSAPGSVANPN